MRLHSENPAKEVFRLCYLNIFLFLLQELWKFRLDTRIWLQWDRRPEDTVAAAARCVSQCVSQTTQGRQRWKRLTFWSEAPVSAVPE
ncbi:unnamed protein product [Tetraodon nigroviridis]|uniref:(spotted green pufferfish) hypothetical protein n=1 Tax=Tetraodon nigroviridis TaxID=99883 RepID=Q4T8I1_TETNG|nr:unnamed protein product [Tetraodon nigroviridis]